MLYNYSTNAFYGVYLLFKYTLFYNILKICKTRSFANTYLGKTAKEKKFSVTYYSETYERNNVRIQSPKGKDMNNKRQSTVPPSLILNTIYGLTKNKYYRYKASQYNHTVLGDGSKSQKAPEIHSKKDEKCCRATAFRSAI
jgi:hypothetical protein